MRPGTPWKTTTEALSEAAADGAKKAGVRGLYVLIAKVFAPRMRRVFDERATTIADVLQARTARSQAELQRTISLLQSTLESTTDGQLLVTLTALGNFEADRLEAFQASAAEQSQEMAAAE